MTQGGRRQEVDENQGTSGRCKDEAWECGACGGLLAFVDAATHRELRIKYKDLFVWVLDPKQVRIACRSCGAINQTGNTLDATDVELRGVVETLRALVARTGTPCTAKLLGVLKELEEVVSQATSSPGV